jgi:hypothetical protein
MRPLINSRAFLRGGWRALTVPTEVIVRAVVVGTWYPASWDARRPDQPAKVPQAITSAPSAGLRFGESRPAPKGGK